jgi:hypothetical protein
LSTPHVFGSVHELELLKHPQTNSFWKRKLRHRKHKPFPPRYLDRKVVREVSRPEILDIRFRLLKTLCSHSLKILHNSFGFLLWSPPSQFHLSTMQSRDAVLPTTVRGPHNKPELLAPHHPSLMFMVVRTSNPFKSRDFTYVGKIGIRRFVGQR